MKNYLQPFTIILVLTSCASSYNSIKPSSINYQTNLTNQNVDFSYKYGVLSERGNKKYAKKEPLKGIKVAAVKVTNNSNKSFVFGQHLKIHSNGNPVNLLEPKLIHQNLKQGVPIYLLYLLLTPLQLNTGDDSTPIGLVIGPGITIGNMVGAGAANSNFLKELENYFLNGKTIHAGETIYGIIGIYDSGFSPLTLELE
jgi:hypothetical protein